MFTDFERCRRTIARREVTVTSWVNQEKASWMASAPRYVHLLATPGVPNVECATRAQAIERVVRELTERFGSPRPGD